MVCAPTDTGNDALSSCPRKVAVVGAVRVCYAVALESVALYLRLNSLYIGHCIQGLGLLGYLSSLWALYP